MQKANDRPKAFNSQKLISPKETEITFDKNNASNLAEKQSYSKIYNYNKHGKYDITVCCYSIASLTMYVTWNTMTAEFFMGL